VRGLSAGPAAVSPRHRWRALCAEALRFGGVGVLSYGLGIGLAAFGHEIAGLPERVAVAISLATVLVSNFFLARIFIFRSEGRVHHELARFAATSAIMRGIEYLAFLALLNAAELGYLVAMTVAMVASTIAKFFVYRSLVFRKPLSPRP
jgi:putative flippase GtrA